MIIDSEKTVISVIVLSPFTSSQDKPPILPTEFFKIVSLTLDRELQSQPAQAAASGGWGLFISTTAELVRA